jgi:hypothetical protein
MHRGARGALCAHQPDATSDALLDKLFVAFSAQVQNIVKKQLTEKANKAKDELSSMTSAVSTSLHRVPTAFGRCVH